KSDAKFAHPGCKPDAQAERNILLRASRQVSGVDVEDRVVKLENRCSEIDTRRALQAASERVIGDFKGPQAFIYAAVRPVRLPPEREGVDADAILVIPRVIKSDGRTRPEDGPQRQRMFAVEAQGFEPAARGGSSQRRCGRKSDGGPCCSCT